MLRCKVVTNYTPKDASGRLSCSQAEAECGRGPDSHTLAVAPKCYNLFEAGLHAYKACNLPPVIHVRCLSRFSAVQHTSLHLANSARHSSTAMATRIMLRKVAVTSSLFNRRISVVVRASEQPVKAPAAVGEVVESYSVPAAQPVSTATATAITPDNKTVSFGGKRCRSTLTVRVSRDCRRASSRPHVCRLVNVSAAEPTMWRIASCVQKFRSSRHLQQGLSTSAAAILLRRSLLHRKYPCPHCHASLPVFSRSHFIRCLWIADAMAFANPVGPETINGRLAMIGVLAAIGAELSTGKSFFTQFESATPIVLATWAIIALASLVPIMKGEFLLANAMSGLCVACHYCMKLRQQQQSVA